MVKSLLLYKMEFWSITESRFHDNNFEFMDYLQIIFIIS